MGEWKEGAWYDDGAWMGPRAYAPRWPANWATVRFAVWARKILELGGPDVPILDIGSGNGMFTAMLWHLGHRGRYVGFDFSPGATAEAIEGNRDQGGHQNCEFILCDLEQANIGELSRAYFKEAPMVISGECLEHTRDDRKIVDTIPAGTQCVITLPRFDAEAHIRWWYAAEDLRWYWSPFFDHWRQEWITSKIRDPERQCHLFWGFRNEYRWTGEPHKGPVVAPKDEG